MVTKNMVSPTSRWLKVRDGFEKAYDKYTKEHFLDFITTSYISKEVDVELAEKELLRRV